MPSEPEPLSKQAATDLFLRLVAAWGLRWTASVPPSAYDDLQRVSAVLTPDEKRIALSTVSR